MPEPGAPPDRSFRGPIVSPVACPGCGKLVDPLRAGHVAIFHDKFHFFCDWSCRQDYLAHEPEGHAPASVMEPLPRQLGRVEHVGEPTAAPRSEPVTEVPAAEQGPGQEDEIQEQGEPRTGHWDQAISGSDVGTLLLLSATVSGVLSLALALVGTSSTVLTIRVVIACVGVGLLAARAVLGRRNPADANPLVVLGPTVVAAAVAIWAKVARQPIAEDAAVLTGLAVVAIGTTAQLVEHVRREASTTLEHLQEALNAPARKVVPSGYAVVSASNLRPGEEVVIDAGEMVPADATISAGEATVLPWIDALSAAKKGPGDPLVAGAKVLTGRVRATGVVGRDGSGVVAHRC